MNILVLLENIEYLHINGEGFLSYIELIYANAYKLLLVNKKFANLVKIIKWDNIKYSNIHIDIFLKYYPNSITYTINKLNKYISINDYQTKYNQIKNTVQYLKYNNANIQFINYMFVDYSKLLKLDISYCSNAYDGIFTNLSNLIYLDISYINILTGYNLPISLQTLIIKYCNSITNESINRLNNLIELDISGCMQINYNAFINNGKSLRKLYAGHTNLDNKCLEYLLNIENLNLYYNEHIDDMGIKYIGNSLRNLVIIDCNLITDNGIKYLVNLKSLELRYIFECNITGVNFEYMRNLNSLIIGGNIKLFIDTLYKVKNSLQSFSSFNNNICDEMFYGLKLVKLNLQNSINKFISNNTLEYLSDTLEELNIKDSILNIDNNGLLLLNKLKILIS